MMKKVYICAPLGGNIEKNIECAKRYTEYALKCETAPVVSHFYALCLNDDIPAERETGIRAGMCLLRCCDEMWVFGDEITDGMRGEMELCENLGIKIREIDNEELCKMIGEDLYEKNTDCNNCNTDNIEFLANGICCG